MEKVENIKELFILVRKNSYKLNNIFDKSFNGMFSVLELLIFQKERTMPSDIAKILGMKTPQVAFILRNLKTKKYIKIEQDKEDKRKKYVFITETGKEAVIKEEKGYFEHFKQIFSTLTNEELELLINTFKKLVR